MWIWRNCDPGAVADRLFDGPPCDSFSRWAWGVIAAMTLASYGLVSTLTGSALFLGGRPLRVIDVHGTAAVSVGCVYLAVGLFLHAHFVLASFQRSYVYGELGKVIALLGFVISLGTYAVQSLS